MSSLDDAQLGQVLAASIADQQAQANAQHQKNIANINALWSEKERNNALKNQSDQVEKQNNILSGRANRAEKELRDIQDRFSKLEKEYAAYKDASERAVLEVIADSDKLSKDEILEKFRGAINRSKTENLSTPSKPTIDELEWYIKQIKSHHPSISDLTKESLASHLITNQTTVEKLIEIYQSLLYWQAKGKFLGVPVNNKQLTKFQRGGAKLRLIE